MGRFRNPRYAPEFLEKRLSPSSLPVSSASVLVSTYSTSTALRSTTLLPDDSPLPPSPDTGLPPLPTGPAGPA